MTHSRPKAFLARRWRSLAQAAVLLVLSGAVLLIWLRINAKRSTPRASRPRRTGATTRCRLWPETRGPYAPSSRPRAAHLPRRIRRPRSMTYRTELRCLYRSTALRSLAGRKARLALPARTIGR